MKVSLIIGRKGAPNRKKKPPGARRSHADFVRAVGGRPRPRMRGSRRRSSKEGAESGPQAPAARP
jgi:hypothetical protein